MPAHDRPEPVTITPSMLREWKPDTVSRGTVLVIGGARQVPGAVQLSGIAALRAGAGTLQLALAETNASPTAVAVPEAMVIGLPENSEGAVSRDCVDVLRDLVAQAQSVVIGVGLTEVEETSAMLERLLPEVSEDSTVVIDAYALGALSKNPDLAKPVHGRAVLTPNTEEAAFLLQRPGDPIDNHVSAAVEISNRYQAVVSLMGVVAEPGGAVWRDGTGHIGLDTSGSGDVLAGLVGGFLARSKNLARETCWASHVHAMAGQRLIPRTSMTGMLARELLEEVPQVIVELRG
jgi:ADP-dependent NAD(P)H-hydrate dehydratase